MSHVGVTQTLRRRRLRLRGSATSDPAGRSVDVGNQGVHIGKHDGACASCGGDDLHVRVSVDHVLSVDTVKAMAMLEALRSGHERVGQSFLGSGPTFKADTFWALQREGLLQEYCFRFPLEAVGEAMTVHGSDEGGAGCSAADVALGRGSQEGVRPCSDAAGLSAFAGTSVGRLSSEGTPARRLLKRRKTNAGLTGSSCDLAPHGAFARVSLGVPTTVPSIEPAGKSPSCRSVRKKPFSAVPASAGDTSTNVYVGTAADRVDAVVSESDGVQKASLSVAMERNL